ncbi:MAG: hypothetical protein E4H09_01270 [Spirochaetales bacterium]|nr:MAG: hypothetical protein E4H09_01270 [Spirochaetales bacterium]
MKRVVGLLRDMAIVLAGTAAIASQVNAERWLLVALAVIAPALWIASARIPWLPETIISQVLFLGLAALLTIRVADVLLPVNIAGIWLLLCAMDLQRLFRFFPAASPARQLLVTRRHLIHLGVIGAASAVVALMSRITTVPLRLTAVLLVGVFVMVVVMQLVTKVSEPPDSGQE